MFQFPIRGSKLVGGSAKLEQLAFQFPIRGSKKLRAVGYESPFVFQFPIRGSKIGSDLDHIAASCCFSFPLGVVSFAFLFDALTPFLVSVSH